MPQKLKFSQTGEPIVVTFTDANGRRVEMTIGVWVTSVEDLGVTAPPAQRYLVGLRNQLIETKVEGG